MMKMIMMMMVTEQEPKENQSQGRVCYLTSRVDSCNVVLKKQRIVREKVDFVCCKDTTMLANQSIVECKRCIGCYLCKHPC